MCNLKHPVTSLPQGDSGGAPIGNDPAATGTLPLTGESTTTTMQPTKFAKLLKVVVPMVQGGLAGGFGGDWKVPGSGFQAAGNFFQRQTENAMQKKALANQQANQQSEIQLRQQEGQRQAALAQGAGRIYDAAGPDGEEEHQYRIRPDGTSEDLGKKVLPDQFQAVNSGGDLMMFDKRHGTVEQPTDMNPEEHGALPLPNEDQTRTLPFGPPTKQPAPTVLHQGDIAVDRQGNTVAKGSPKTFAPKTPKASATKPDTGKVETYAQRFLTNLNGDADQAIKKVEESNLPPELKAPIRQRIREMARPGEPKKSSRKFNLVTPEQQKQVQQAGQ